MATAPGKCIFCGNGGLTKEHMFADWLRNFIPREMLEHRIQTSLDFPDRTQSSVQHRTGDPHSRRIRCVCAACNSGWMSQFQEDTKPFLVPMLRGEPTSSHRKAQTQIATWITMTVMVAEFLNRDQVAVSSEERQWFFKNARPPRHWRIWIGQHRGKTSSLWTHNAMSLTEEKPETIATDTIHESNTQTSTILLGEHLIIHIMSSLIARRIIRLWKLPPSIAPLMSQIWPIRNPRVTWPPGSALTDADIQLLADQFYKRVTAQVRRPSGLS